MGDAQSAQREARNDAAEEEESGTVKDAETGQNIDDKEVRNNGKIAEIISKADDSIAAFRDHCEDEIAVEAVYSADVAASESPKEEEETPVENDNIILKELLDDDEANRVGTDEMIEMDTKQNDINESFRKFFSNISLKLTVKRGSTDKDATRQEPEEQPNKSEDVKATTNEITTENDQLNLDLNAPHEAHEDVTAQDLVEKAEENTTGTKEEMASPDPDAGTTSPVSEEEEPRSTSPADADGKEIATQFKKFFTTGIFSGLRKKKSLVEDNISGKELLDMVENVNTDSVDQQQHEEKDVTSRVDGTEIQLSEEKPKQESLQATDEAKPPSIVVNEILNSQEKDKVQASPLKRLMSGSSFKKRSKKQRGRRSSDTKLSDSGEHGSDQLLSSTESADNQKEDSLPHPSAKEVDVEDGAWASFKKLMTPQKLIKRLSVDHDEGQIPGVADGTKPGDGEQISDHSTEEGKKRKDSSVSWEAVLCGSGRRRSRKTSDSDEEILQVDSDNKQESGAKEAPLGASDEVQEVLASSPKQTGSPQEGDEGSAWKSFKKLVTPKRKVKDDNESNTEAAQDDSYFSIKKILPGRKERRSAEQQDQVSSDDADKEAASDDEDSETPAVVPLSEFDSAETPVQIQTQVQSQTAEKEDTELQKNLHDEQTETVPPSDGLQTEAKEITSSKEALEHEEPEDPSEEISKHQQLSDIPEEITPAEEAARDETITEDLLEITSEAITAPEPADVTNADETEMISAVSQLTESSKTSGNTTPVPADYDVMNTESLLQQVSEIISASPTEVPVCTEEQSSVRVVCSVKHQILESSVTDQPKILEIHRESDATALKTGLNVEDICPVNELAAVIQMENISHLSEVLSTEVVSEMSTEEFDTVEPAADEFYEVSVSELKENIKESEMSDESRRGVEHTSTETEGRMTTDQAEKDRLKTNFQEEELEFASSDKTEDAADQKEIQTLVEDENKAVEHLSEEPPAVWTDELETSTKPSETSRKETKQTDDVTETADDAEEEEPEAAADKTDPGEDAEITDDLQPLTSEPESVDPSITKEENISSAEKDTDGTKHGEFLSRMTENTEQQPDGVQTECAEITEVIETPEDEVQLLHKDTVFSEVDADQQESEEDSQPGGVQMDHAEVTDADKVIQTSKSQAEETFSESISPAEVDLEEQEQKESRNKDKIEPQTDGATAEHVEMTEAEVVQEDEVQFLHKDIVFSEVDADQQEESEEDSQPGGVQTDHAEVSDGIETTTAESQEEELFSESIPPAEVGPDVPKRSESLVKETQELKSKEPQTDRVKVDHVEMTVEVVETPASESQEEEIQFLQKDIVFSESISPDEVDQHRPEECFTEVSDGAKTDDANVKTPVEDVSVSESVPAAQVDTDEQKSPQQDATDERQNTRTTLEPEVLLEDPCLSTDTKPKESLIDVHAGLDDGPKAENDPEPESAAGSTSDPEAETLEALKDGSSLMETVLVQTTDVMTESERQSAASSPDIKDVIAHHVEESQLLVEGSNTQTSETLVEDVPQPDENVTEEMKVGSPHQASEVETGSLTCDAQVEHEENIPEAVDELQGFPTLHVSSANEEPGSVEVLETTICPERTPAPCANKAEVSDEPVHEVNLCELQETAEVEKTHELPDAEMKVATTDQDVVTHGVTFNLKDVSLEKPSVLAQEPLFSRTLSETEFNEAMETATPLVRDDRTETAEESDVVVMMNLPSVEIEVNHRIQVQEMDVDIRSAENRVETVIEVGVSGDSEVVDVCHETIEEVKNFSASPGIEEEMINEGIKVTVEEVTQHMKSDLLQVVEGSEMDQNKSNEPEDLLIKDNTESVVRRQEVVSEDPATEQQESEDPKQTNPIPEHLDISIKDHKDDLETSGDAATQKLDEKNERCTETHEAQTPTNTNFRLATPQNTGAMSSTGNLESPSSLSLEFKLNIQFGQAVIKTPPSPPTQRTEPLNQTETLEVGVQAVESVEPEQEGDKTQTSEKQTELNEIYVQATETTEQAENSHSTHTAVISSQPVLQNVPITEPTENPEVQAAKTLQPGGQKETKPGACLEQTEEDNDQDVWLDAEEDIYKQEETKISTNKMEQPAEQLTESKQDKQAEPELQTKESESQRNTLKATGRCENESDGEDFSVALEDLESSSSVVEWD